MRHITLAIPYYNNSRFIGDCLSFAVSDDRVSEIVVCDDNSDDVEELKRIISNFNSKKIKLFENESNLGVYSNKLNSIEKSSNDWVILFDSDNVLSSDYLDALYNIEIWNSRTIYAPSYIQKINEYGQSIDHFDYRKFIGLIDKYNFFKFETKDSLFQTMMNTCNYFVNKNEYLSVQNNNSQNYDTNLISSLDSITLLSDWLIASNSVNILDQMGYKHRIHNNSSYLRNYTRINGDVWTNNLFQRISDSIKISLCIPNYERSDILIESFIDVINDNRIQEIIIVDDNSRNYEEIYQSEVFRNSKIKLIRNESNLGTFFNKLKAVESSSTDFLILLDSDNKIDKNYIDSIYREDWDVNTILCPEILNHHENNCWNESGVFISYENLIGKNINYDFCRESILNNVENKLMVLLNTGNYFVNKYSYINSFNNNEFDRSVDITDVGFFNYLFLSCRKKNSMRIVQGLEYTHRVHNGSFFINNSYLSANMQDLLKNKFIRDENLQFTK
jgi:glycosyltransferase involved in cell wall biosynthesis